MWASSSANCETVQVSSVTAALLPQTIGVTVGALVRLSPIVVAAKPEADHGEGPRRAQLPVRLGRHPLLERRRELYPAADLRLQPGAPDYDEHYAKVLPEIERRVEALRGTVLEAGGLYIIGTERHESRRIDNQLRGRSGRQGDPGESRFFLSAEDDVIRLFAGDRIFKILDRLGPTDDDGALREAVFRAAITAGLVLRELRLEAASLEELFARATSASGERPA